MDDEPGTVDLFHSILSSDYEVFTAPTGEAAIDMLRDGTQPDLVLTDINMPLMNGYDVCQFVRSNPGTEDVPVLFISGLITAEERERGNEAGGTGFVSKPFSVLGLRQKLGVLLSDN